MEWNQFPCLQNRATSVQILVSSVSEGPGQGSSVVAEFACANIVSSPAETVQTCRDKAQSLVTVLAIMPGKVIVYGGRGGLGVVVVSTFRQAGYEVSCDWRRLVT